MKEQLLSESSGPCHSESRDKMGSMAPELSAVQADTRDLSED